MKKLLKIQKNKGMTYVEIIVVLGIFATMSSIVMFNYGEFQAKVDIKNWASDIALKVVEAQKSAMSGNLPSSGSPPSTWKPSYGVYFNLSAGTDTDGIPFNQKFIYFADLDSLRDYTGGSSCTGECLDKIIITKDNTISKLEVIGTGCPTTVTNLTIVFKRPDSSAIISPACTSISYAEVSVVSPKAATARIKIYPSGRIQVN